MTHHRTETIKARLVSNSGGYATGNYQPDSVEELDNAGKYLEVETPNGAVYRIELEEDGALRIWGTTPFTGPQIAVPGNGASNVTLIYDLDNFQLIPDPDSYATHYRAERAKETP